MCTDGHALMRQWFDAQWVLACCLCEYKIEERGLDMRPIPGFPEYKATEDGRIWSSKSERWLKQIDDQKGYPRVGLYRDGRRHSKKVATLVALTFYGPRPAGQEVRHLDGDRANSRVSNLAYGTPSQNNHDQVFHGTHANAAKTHCLKGHPFSGDNLYVRPDGKRSCRACARTAALKHYHEKKPSRALKREEAQHGERTDPAGRSLADRRGLERVRSGGTRPGEGRGGRPGGRGEPRPAAAERAREADLGGAGHDVASAA